MMRFCISLAVLIVANLALDIAAAQPAKSPAPAKKARVDQFGDPLPDGAFARIGTTRYRHGGKLLLGFTPDGKSLIYHGGGAIHFMDVATGKFREPVIYAKDEPHSIGAINRNSNVVALSGDTRVLAVHSYVGVATVAVIETATGKEQKRLQTADYFKEHHSLSRADLALSEDGRLLLIYCGRDNEEVPISWVETTSGRHIAEIAPEAGSYFLDAQFSPDGTQVVALQCNRGKGFTRVRVFDAIQGTEIRTVDVPANRQFRFALLPDGKTLVAANEKGGTVRRYDYASAKLKEIREFSDLSNGSLALSQDGKQLYIASRGTVRHWDVSTGKEIRRIDVPGMPKNEGAPPGPLGWTKDHVLTVSPDGKQLAFSGPLTAMLFDTDSGKVMAGGSGGAAVDVVRFTPDSKGIVVSDSNAVHLWDVQAARMLKTFAGLNKGGSGPSRDFQFFGPDRNAAFSEDGKLLAVGMKMGGVNVWDTMSGEIKKVYRAEQPGKVEDPDPAWESMPVAFAFAPRGNLLAVATPIGGAKLWDAASGKSLRSMTSQAAMVRQGDGFGAVTLALAFSPDGKTLACARVVGFEGRAAPQLVIVLWETATGKERLRFQDEIKELNNEIAVYMAYSLLDQMTSSLTFSPDGRQLIVSTFSTLYLLDAATGKDVVSYTSRHMIGRTATFSRDGKLLFLGRTDGKLRIHNAASGRVVRDLPAHTESIMALNLSPDGKTLASGSSDSTVLLWDVDEIARPQPEKKAALTNQDLERLWSELASDDATKAYQAINTLASAPAESVPFLKGKLKPIQPVERKVLDTLLEDLNSDKFAVREKATSELEKLGALAKSALQERLQAKPPLETKQRIDKLLAKLDGPIDSAPTLQAMRAIETLEHIGTPAALDVLVVMAKGAPGHPVTDDARESAERLQKQLKAK